MSNVGYLLDVLSRIGEAFEQGCIARETAVYEASDMLTWYNDTQAVDAQFLPY